MANEVLSTYRLQLRGPASGRPFTFADAESILDYLHDLGVSHLYLSPVLTATPGSAHGYDVTDPTAVSAELGGPEGLRRLSKAAAARGMGLIIDIVPNHLGVDSPRHNPWWWDVLAHGQGSTHATYFDIDWEPENGAQGRIALPLLASDEDLADLVVDDGLLRLRELVLPIAPGTGHGSASAIHDRQHYKLISWKSNLCGYRRFFAVTALAALRQEDRAVFDLTHQEVARWFAEGLVDGLRVDHPDGLSDPALYLTWLRELTGPAAWIVIEKILAADEALEPTLPVAGTTGYDALREIGGLLIDPAGAAILTALYESCGVDYAEIAMHRKDLKAFTAVTTLSNELLRVRRAITRTTGQDDPAIPAAVAALLANVDVYRSDYRSLTAVMPTAVATTTAAHPELTQALGIVAAALSQFDEVATRTQQLCGAVTAKSVEDSLFYRDARLVSLNEVGGDPERFGVSAAEFHLRAAARAKRWPGAMVTLTTHDTKRGEDVRARIGVLSQDPSKWCAFVKRCQELAHPPDADTALFLLQNIFGVWPLDGYITADLRKRLHDYTEKAIREAGLRTSWDDPDLEFEAAAHSWLDAVLDGPIADEMTTLVSHFAIYAHNDSLSQKLLALTAPGVPDIYQGTEIWEDSLVDPDNRRAVDYAALRNALTESTHPKIRVVAAALALRKERPETFLHGRYTPLLADGDAADHLVAFYRGQDILVAITRHSMKLDQTGWGKTVIDLGSGTWTDRLSGHRHHGTVAAADLFGTLPVALLVLGSESNGDD
ncbi:malto-oligosyltrehalose synthase [Mycobacteroides chelonae]|uniref:malto-oligosyltrehalose synthase n=1 Tax=Mycobacteroides chelonae TaxID=1774 RepID=UPI0039EA0020